MVIMVLSANGQELWGKRALRNSELRVKVVSSASCPAVFFSVPMTGVDPTKQKMTAQHFAWNGVSG